MKWKRICIGALLLWQMSSSQEVVNATMNAGALNVKIQNGGITSSIGESIVGDLGLISSGFQQPVLDIVAPVELQLFVGNKKGNWAELLETGSTIQVFDLQGRSIVTLPANLSKHDFQSLIQKLPSRAFLFYSRSAKAEVSFVAYPNHFSLN